MVYSLGQKVSGTKAIGLITNNMERGIIVQRAANVAWHNGSEGED